MKEAEVLLSHPPHHNVGRFGKCNGHLMLDEKLWWSLVSLFTLS